MEINYNKSPYTRWLSKIDNKFGKPDLRDLIVLFWFMSSWKTELSYFMARRNVANWIKVCYMSLELPEYDMKLRIARKSAWVSKIDFQNWNYDDVQKAIMDTAFKQLNEQEWLYINKPEINNMQNIMRSLREHYDFWCRLFVIDNLDKINWDANDNTRYQSISSELQDFKNENNCCVILIHHAKKPSSTSLAYSPAWMSWLRWSQKILDNATQVVEIYRDLDPDMPDEDRRKVTLYQYKDTFEWANWFVDIYFNKWEYVEEYQSWANKR